MSDSRQYVRIHEISLICYITYNLATVTCFHDHCLSTIRLKLPFVMNITRTNWTLFIIFTIFCQETLFSNLNMKVYKTLYFQLFPIYFSVWQRGTVHTLENHHHWKQFLYIFWKKTVDRARTGECLFEESICFSLKVHKHVLFYINFNLIIAFSNLKIEKP